RLRGGEDFEIAPVATAQVGLDELAAVVHLPGGETGDADPRIDEALPAFRRRLDASLDDPRAEVEAEAEEGSGLLVRRDRPDDALDGDALVMVAAREQIVEVHRDRLGQAGMAEDLELRIVDTGEVEAGEGDAAHPDF